MRDQEYCHRLTREQLAMYTESLDLKLNMSDDQIDDTLNVVDRFLDEITNGGKLLEFDLSEFKVRHLQRAPGRVPTANEDPWNSVKSFCDVIGSEVGPLLGMQIGIKDKIAVAGIPIGSCGESIPSEDALVVRRLLDAGVRIVAKTSMDYSASGVRNPHDSRYSPGFSSAGCGAAVSSGIVDASVGSDSGGSVRIPAAWCGVVGIKPTHGLVPNRASNFNDKGRSDGVLAGVISKDEVCELGPLTTSVTDNAKMLAVMSGHDIGIYTADISGGIKGLRIGVVEEALEASKCTNGILDTFDEARQSLADLGSNLVPVSIPLWSYGPSALYVAAQLLNPAQSIRQSIVKEYLREGDYSEYGSYCQYAILWQLRQQVDAVLRDVDVLITPTTTRGPCKLENLNSQERAEIDFFREILIASRNTGPLNLSGHPALSVPCATRVDKLPVGLQIIGRKFDERTVYRVGFAFETTAARN